MLEHRAIADELMDADDLDADTYGAVMHDLARVNTITLARRPTLLFLDRLATAKAARLLAAAQAEAGPGMRVRMGPVPLRILDVGFGDGDMLRAIARWAARRNVAAELTGIDLNPRSLAAARTATPAEMTIDWRTGDYAELAGMQWDAVISSLVAHHMSHPQLVAFLRFMDGEAREGWFINDLHRHGFAYQAFPLLARLTRWHPIVAHDGRLSIARSYRPHEWAPILAEARVSNVRVFRAFPFRLCVEKRR